MDLTMLPDQTRPRSNVFAAIYGEGGTGKTQMALRMAHRLTAAEDGIIVAIEADGDRMRFHAESRPGAGDGFRWKPIRFDQEFNPLELGAVLNELAEAAADFAGPVCIIIDGATKFWSGHGGLRWRNDHVHARTTKSGKLDTFSGWQTTGEEEQQLYATMRHLKKHAHLILCLEQSNERDAKEQLIGVKMDFRKGLSHVIDFIFRTERYFGQQDTSHDPAARGAARDIHRAIAEKTPLGHATPQPDGTVDYSYPLPTGTVFPDPGAEVVDLILKELCAAEDNAEAEAQAFLTTLQDRSRTDLLEAHRWVKHYAPWPDDIRSATMDALVELGTSARAAEIQQQNTDPETTPDQPDTTELTAEWADLVTGSDIDEWLYTAAHLCRDEPDRENQIRRFAAFIAWATGQDRLDLIKVPLAEHAQSLGIDIKTDVLGQGAST